jgi:dsDNA-binding SOS-regulon protein
MEKSIKGLNEEQIESIGMLIAENKDALAKAIKGRPESLLESDEPASEGLDDKKVTKISS